MYLVCLSDLFFIYQYLLLYDWLPYLNRSTNNIYLCCRIIHNDNQFTSPSLSTRGFVPQCLPYGAWHLNSWAQYAKRSELNESLTASLESTKQSSPRSSFSLLSCSHPSSLHPSSSHSSSLHLSGQHPSGSHPSGSYLSSPHPI